MKKLLIIVGSGASVEFDMPCVKRIDSLFEEWAKKIIQLKEDPNKSLYSYVKEKIIKYYEQGNQNSINRIANFETIIFTIQQIESLLSDTEWQQFSNRLMPFIEIHELPSILMFGKEKIAGGFELGFIHSYLISNLVSYFREICLNISIGKHSNLQNVNLFLKALKNKFQIGIINLNYDNIILNAMPGLETGFNSETGEFERALLYKDFWNFCFHIHGSVHFDTRGNNYDLNKIYWAPTLNSNFIDSTSKAFNIEGLSHLNSPIIVGLDKANQILREPFASYFSQINRLIHECDSILILGYGFADRHLNQALRYVNDSKKKRNIVIVDWAEDDEDSLINRQDNWTYGLASTISYGYSSQSLPNLIGHYKENKSFEKYSNSNNSLSVWYGGFMAACENVGLILNELERD